MNPYDAKYEQHDDDHNPCARTRIILDEYNSDLNFVVEGDGLTGSSLHRNGFGYLWAGARATHGVSRGKVFYEVLVQEKLDVEVTESNTKPHVMRVGWSVDSSHLTVGESHLSYGYGGTGKSSCNNKFYNYGEPYSTNDVITCYIDLDAVPKTIFFAKNGNYLGVAFSIGPEADGKVFYPHITVKNMRFAINFGGQQPYFPPVQGFTFIEFLPPNLLCVPVVCLKERHHCEVLMMVGLPSCGKTTWLEKFVRDHPEKKYYILGTNEILCKMKVMGLTRKRNYHGRWDALIKKATGILNEMLKIAQHKNRNYILDQTNVYPNARRRKMNNFRYYKHIAVVVVNTNSVLMARNEKVVQKDGKVIPESAFMEMKANFTLPVEGEIFDEVWYVEENQERSMELVKEFNREGNIWKEEQKKRPADDLQKNKNEPHDMKRPSRYENPANSNPSETYHPRGNVGQMNRHNQENSSNDLGQGSAYHEERYKGSFRQDDFSTEGPPRGGSQRGGHQRGGHQRGGHQRGGHQRGGSRSQSSRGGGGPPRGGPPRDRPLSQPSYDSFPSENRKYDTILSEQSSYYITQDTQQYNQQSSPQSPFPGSQFSQPQFAQQQSAQQQFLQPSYSERYQYYYSHPYASQSVDQIPTQDTGYNTYQDYYGNNQYQGQFGNYQQYQ